MLSRREFIVASAFAIVISFLLLLGSFAIYEVQQQQRTTQNIYDHPFTVTNGIREIEFLMVSIHDKVEEIAAARSPEAIDAASQQIATREKRALALFAAINERFLGDKALISRAREAFINWKPLRDQEIAMAREGLTKQVSFSIVDRDSEYLTQLIGLIQPIIDFAMRKGESFYSQAFAQSSRTLFHIYLLLAGLLLTAITIAAYIVVSLRRAQQRERAYLDTISQNERRYRELLNAAPDGVIIIDDAQRIQIVNKQAESIFGYQAEELVGKPIEQLVPEPSKGGHPHLVTSFLNSPEARNLQPGMNLRGRRKDGSTFPASVSLGPVSFDGKTLVTAMIRDISHELEVEQKLRQAQKMEAIGTVVGGIAHEFNNILAAIVGNIYLAKLKLHAADNPHLNNIENVTERAAGIVHKLMHFAHKGILRMDEVSLSPLIRDCLEEIGADKIRLECRCPDKACMIEGDADQIRQVILGLLSNAVDAVSGVASARIRVELQPFEADPSFRERHPETGEERYAHLMVEDNGCGIPEAVMEHIFEPFYSTKEVGKGSGLGLSMIQGVVESHHGAIEVDSAPGQGCRVSIYLPLATREAVQPLVSTAQSLVEGSIMPLREERAVLIADDELPVRDIMQKLLERMHYRVLTASDGVEAINTFQANRQQIALVILDVLMPHMDGAEAARRIRDANPDLPIIFVTGYDRQVLREYHLEQLQHIQLLTKPFSVAALFKAVRQMQP